MGEKSKARQSKIAAAIALNFADEFRLLSKDSLTEMEEAIEAFVPDLFIPSARYRQTGFFAFWGEDETIAIPSKESMDTVEANIVSKA